MGTDEKIYKVLVIDDEKDIREILMDTLENHGLTPSSATDGKDGLEIARATQPDLILLDIMMPKMDGIEMLQELRNDPWGRTVPVILLSNINDKERLREAEKIGIQASILKAEWKISDIIRKVDELLAVSEHK
jgi:CheY-like chemotaxis protein